MLQIWGRVPDVAEMVERIDAVSLADVRRVAETTVADAPAALALYGPVSGAPDIASLDARRAA
jgi:predicted Zn-dependent peptidase